MRVKQRLMNSRTTIFLKVKIELNADISAAQKKVPPIPLGDNLSGTAGQKTLRDAPVVVKLRR